jgi:hypothetical protein
MVSVQDQRLPFHPNTTALNAVGIAPNDSSHERHQNV